MSWADRIGSWFRLQQTRCLTCGELREHPRHSELFCSDACEEEYEKAADRPM